MGYKVIFSKGGETLRELEIEDFEEVAFIVAETPDEVDVRIFNAEGEDITASIFDAPNGLSSTTNTLLGYFMGSVTSIVVMLVLLTAASVALVVALAVLCLSGVLLIPFLLGDAGKWVAARGLAAARGLYGLALTGAKKAGDKAKTAFAKKRRCLDRDQELVVG